MVTYTPLGQMDRLIDIWDQPPQPNPGGSMPDPVLFAEGVYASIEGLWATTEAKKLAQQILSEISHRIIIRYMPGLKSRMFIRYNDPDSTDDDGNVVPRRFTIDKIIDPDEHKVELRILATERNDGQ